ncbi:small-conductance mechanosensitive channel [Pseudomonas sp. JAI115]|uniref:hypothetical protein n=1 Tax=Pseudomonas sp. JAI115 TaxID=2723061 RepID=UPI00160B8990|nr:hypothetical protein [Pseudomonas sp. JAI115]MBB6155179.1 small-conductance mechanosensitive channel [Pseudomonas sp. JAI115]
MNELERLKGMLLELNQNQLKFSGQLRAFEALQNQISHLQGRAHEDADASRKLHNVNDYMTREGHQAQRQILAHIGAFANTLQDIRTHLEAQTIVPARSAPQGEPATAKQPVKKRDRPFV